MKNILSVTVSFLLLTMSVVNVTAQEQRNLQDDMFEFRAMESLIWAMPLLNLKQFRDGHFSLGVN
jgi:hypothetical protein